MQETRFVFDLKDITNIRYVCREKDCGGKIVCPPNGKYRLPQECPYCGARWSDSAISNERELKAVMKRILEQENSPIRLRFELSWPDSDEDEKDKKKA